MAIDRREFCRTAAAAGVTLGTGIFENSDVAALPRSTSSGTGMIEFNFTGLIAAELWQKAEKQRRMLVSLVDAPAAGLNETHTAALMVRLDDFIWPDQYQKYGVKLVDGLKPHKELPQIVRLGGQKFGLWNLERSLLWMGERQDDLANEDTESDFLFPTGGANTTARPDPIDMDAGWVGREWFITRADLYKAAGVKYDPVSLDPRLIAAQVRITHGQGYGLAPATACEQYRTYSLTLPSNPARTYGSEFKVLHETKGQTTDLRITAMYDGKPVDTRGDVIVLKTPSGAAIPTPVSILNMPLTAIGATMEDHFVAYSNLLRLPKIVCLFPQVDNEHCAMTRFHETSKMTEATARRLKERQSTEARLTAPARLHGFAPAPLCQREVEGAENPPDPGCIPLFVEND
jgi:hypothetical protein